MALIGINHGTHHGVGRDGYHSSFPQTAPRVQATGIAAQEINLIDTQVYNIDLFNDFKSFKPREFPMLTILAEMGGGQMLDRHFETWTDEYEGDDMVDIMLDQLRLRDTIGDGSAGSVGNPIRIGASGEIGGMLFFQNAKIGASKAAGRSDSFSAIADSQYISIEAPATRSLASASIKETGLIPDVSDSDKKLLVLGFDRSNLGTGATQYQDIKGNVWEVLRKIENVLGVREYEIEDLTCNWDGSSVQTISLKYVANQSKRCHLAFDDLEICKPSGVNAPQEHEIQVVVGIDQLIFDATEKKFVLVLDFNESNLDNLTAGTVATSDITVPTGGAFYQVVQGENITCSSPSGTSLNVGDIFFGAAAATVSSASGSNEAVMTIPYGLLIEETNTSVANDAGIDDRIFGANVTNNNPGGHSRLMRHVIISQYDDLTTAAHEAQGFSDEQRGGYNFSREQIMNFMEIHLSKLWSVTTFRQGQGIKFQDDIALSRARHMREFKQDWTNSFLRGKKSNTVNADGYYQGTTSGILDYEMFPMKYMKVPIPQTGNAIITSSGGETFRNWLNDLAKGLNSKNNVGDYQGHSLLVGMKVLEMMANANATIGSDTSTGGNVFGAGFEMVPPSSLTLGLQVFSYKSMYGQLNFIYDPVLDSATAFKVPRHIFPNVNGRVSPRYTMIAIDKSYISMLTHKSRPDMLHGNLQSNNNPFIYVEGMSGAHLLKMRFPRNHSIIDVTPDI